MGAIRGVSGLATNCVCWVLLILALLTIIARLFTRIRITKFFGLDDVFIIISFFFLVALTVMTSFAVNAGLGSHFDHLSDHDKIRAERWVLIIRCFSVWPLAVPKLSVVALLVRVFEPRRWISVLFYLLAILGLGLAAAVSIVWVIQCTPVEKQYNPARDGSCWPRIIALTLAEIQFAQSVLYDFIFALYPIAVLLKLQMSVQRKIGVCINMALGIMAGVVGIIKICLLNSVGDTEAIDPTFVESQVTIQVAVEASLLIIAACIPTSGPVLVKVKSFITGTVTGSASGTGRSGQLTGNKRKGYLDIEDGIPMTNHTEAPSRTEKSIEVKNIKTSAFD